MPVLEITTIQELGREAKTVDEFFYAEHEPLPYGIRAMTRDMIRQGKILNRYVGLHQNGFMLTIVTVFASVDAHIEWRTSEVMKETQAHWDGRGWTGKTQVIHLADLVDVSA